MVSGLLITLGGPLAGAWHGGTYSEARNGMVSAVERLERQNAGKQSRDRRGTRSVREPPGEKDAKCSRAAGREKDER